MIAQSNFVITVGDKGSVVALHKGSEITNKIFIDNLTDELKTELKRLFEKNKSAPIYILLDTIDQGYRKKTYPFIKKGDVLKLIKRDLHADSDKANLKNFLIIDDNKIKDQPNSRKRWDCIFASASTSDTLTTWLDFLLDMPNHLVGIYMLPIESAALFKLLKSSIRSNSKITTKKGDLYLLIMNNKVSGIRQTVFVDDTIVFTRITNYNFTEENFLERYEQDITNTFEYLKRPYPDLNIRDIDIVNILPAEALAKIKDTANLDLNLINYTPFQAAAEIKYNSAITQNSNYCDLLLSKAFSNNNKKILKFTTPKINILSRLFLVIRSTYYLNLILLMAIGMASLVTIYSYNSLEESKTLAEINFSSASQNLMVLKNKALDGEVLSDLGEAVDLEKILDIGKVHEVLNLVGGNYLEFYSKLKFVKERGVSLTNFQYNLLNFDQKSPSIKTDYKISISGEITNKSGDIEDLFREFDGVVAELKKNFDHNQVTYVELPKNIDFAKKYYTFPVEFTISKGK